MSLLDNHYDFFNLLQTKLYESAHIWSKVLVVFHPKC